MWDRKKNGPNEKEKLSLRHVSKHWESSKVVRKYIISGSVKELKLLKVCRTNK